MRKALLIEFDVSTGKRPADIRSNDPGLWCYSWQKLDVEPALEIRIIQDDRDIAQYENVPGITILEGDVAINAAIDALELERYSIDNEVLFRASMEQKGIDLGVYEGWKPADIFKDLYNRKVLGIRKTSPKKVSLSTV